MRGDVVDLTRRCHVDQVVGLDLYLVARWQEGVEAHYEVGVAFKELRHSADDPGGVDTGNKTKKFAFRFSDYYEFSHIFLFICFSQSDECGCNCLV